MKKSSAMLASSSLPAELILGAIWKAISSELIDDLFKKSRIMIEAGLWEFIKTFRPSLTRVLFISISGIMSAIIAIANISKNCFILINKLSSFLTSPKSSHATCAPHISLKGYSQVSSLGSTIA